MLSTQEIKRHKCAAHGEVKYKCAECKIKKLCSHGNGKFFCKKCPGPGICPHGKMRRNCYECDGSSACIHNKRIYDCRICYQKKKCPHQKEKYRCKQCTPKAFCEHDKLKFRCKLCGGSGYCSHGKRKDMCKECKSSAYCEHGKIRYCCRECGGKGICIHNKRKGFCRECNGSQMCEHARRKYECIPCEGNFICEHGRGKNRCAECGTGLCPSCGLYMTHGILCSTCDPKSTKRKRYDENRIEMKMIQYIQEQLPFVVVFPEQNFGKDCGYTNKKFDCVFFSKTKKYVIVIECDERCHSNDTLYPEKCEWTRPFAAYDIFENPTLFIRWNPDSWKINGETVRVTKKKKMEVLLNYIIPFATEEKNYEENEKLKVTHIYYPTEHSKNPIREFSKEEIEGKLKNVIV